MIQGILTLFVKYVKYVYPVKCQIPEKKIWGNLNEVSENAVNILI